MTTFRRFLSLASASMLAASLAVASELTWDFSFSPSDVSLTPVGEYTVVSLPDGSNVRDALGAPAIPAKFANILLPDGATDVSVAATGDLVLLASDITPYPVQRVAPKSKPQPAFTAPDPAAYASADPWPAAVATYEGLHDMQGSTFVSVRVNPLVYVASEKALYYRPSVAVTVTYTAPSAAPRSTRSVSQNALATEMVNALVVNPESADSPSAFRRRAAARAATVDYLIITSSTLSNAFQNLANYRATAPGGSFKTLVVTTNTIASSYSGDDIQMKIRNCISNYVKSSGTTYVVLGGDDSVVPDRDCYAAVTSQSTYEWHMPTDLYYSDLTGTWKASGNTNFGVRAASVDMSPDVIVGRIPVRTASQLNGYLAKVQAFEADTSHTRNSIIMGGPAAWCRYYANKRPSDNVSLDGHAAFRSTSPAHTYVSDSEMWLRRLYRDGIYTNWNRTESASSRTVNIACDSITSWDSSKCGDKVLSSSNLKTWLNNGYTHLMFSGHGYPQGWGMESSDNYSTTQASSQTGLVAFVYTDACLTGAFDEDGIASSGITVDVGTSDQYKYTSEPCLGEAYIRNASGGALVHMGCARYGWGNPDYQNSDPEDEDSDGYYTNCTASASSDGGPSTVYAYKFYKRLYESAAVSSNRTVGAAFAMSKADMISSCSSDDCERWIQFGLNYLGDPAIALYPRAVADAAPEFSSSTASTNGYVGESIYFDFSDLLSAGHPEPTFTVSTSVSSSLYDWADGLLEFTPSASGTFQFTCTAANGISPNATCTLTVTVTTPPPATPEIPSTPPAASTTSFTATWSAVANAASYKLYVQQKVSASTSARAARDATLLSESFEDGIPSTWSKSASNVTTATGKSGDGDTCVAFKAANVYLMTPALANPSGISFLYKRSSNTTAWTLDVSVANSADGPWTSIGTVADADTSWKTFTGTIFLSGTVYVKFTDNRSTGTHERYIDLVQVTGSSDTWEDVPGSPFTVSGTSRTVSGLSAGTEYRYAVTAVNSQGVESDPTPYVTVETAEGDSAPAISVEQTSYSTTLGGSDVTFYVTASGSPTPTLALASSTAASADYDFDPNDGYFTFTPSATGTFTFTFTATNTEGSDTVTVTVAVSAAPVTVPTLLVDDCTDTTAYALWDACTGVTSYTLQLASDNQFTTGGSGGSVTLFSNDGTDATSAPSGWTYNVSDKTSAYLLMFSGHSVVSESVNASGCTDLSVSLYIRTYGGTSQPNLAIQYSTDNGSTWQDAGTVAAANTTMAQRTLALPAAAASSTLRLRFAPTTTSSSVGVGIKTIVLTGTESSGISSLIATYTVNDTEYTFTGLTPYTVYYARVKGNADWSNVAEFITDEAAASGPVWSALPAQSVSVGGEVNFYPTNYVSGTPFPTVTLASSTAPAADYDYQDGYLYFQPSASGTYTFTFTAVNGSGSANATLTVTATGAAPALTVPQTSYAVTVGDPDVSFAVTATGTPAPTVTASCTEGVYFVFENNEFLFEAATPGTYHFVFTATNSEGSDTETVTIDVSAAPVTVPVLTVTNITDTTAFATWTPCDGVSTYALQLSTDFFPTSSSAARDTTSLLSESFEDGIPATWSKSASNVTAATGKGGDGDGCVAFKAANVYLITPALNNPTGITFMYKRSSNTTAWTLDVSVANSVDGPWTSIGTVSDAGTTWKTFTGTISLTGTVYVKFTDNRSTGTHERYIDLVQVTGTSGGGDDPGGDDIETYTVTGTSYTFTGLAPDSAYVARVKGNAGWSEEVLFETEPAAGAAPVVTVPQASYSVLVGDPDISFAVTATGTPAPTVTATCTDGAYFIFEDGEFLFEANAVGTYHFVFTATNTEGSDSKTVTVTVSDSAPAITVPQTSYAVTVGDPDISFAVTATGAPAPTVTATCTEGAYFIFEDGEFLFEANTVGTYHFVFTASNSAGTATETVTVVVSAAPVTVPVLTVTNITDTTAFASWTPCDGVSTYTLQLSSDFFPETSAAARDATTLLSESFEDGIPDTWSKSASNVTAATGKNGDGDGCVAFKAANVYLITPALSNPTGITFMYKRSSNTTAWTLDVSVANSVDGPWTSIGTVSDAGTTWQTFTGTISLTGTVYVKFTDNRSTGTHERYIDLVQVTGSSGGGDDPGGDDIETYTVTGTSYTFTGLAPDSAYVARVKGNAGWSEEVLFETEAAAGSAPVWSALPAQSVTVGGDVEFYPTNYVSGTPFPTVTLASSTAPAADYDYQNGYLYYQPSALGTFTFTFSAVNDSGSANATLSVASTGTVPVVSVPQTSYNATLGGEDVDFYVTATGTPTPSLSLSATTASSADYDFDPNDGYFTFTPSATGSFTFTFTATSLAGSNSETVTVAVAAPAVTVPVLTISNETDTTADASWTACDDVTTYTLQLATDNQFTAGPGYAEDFTSFPSSSSYLTNSQTVASGTWAYDGAKFTPGGAANGEGSKGNTTLRVGGTLDLPAIDHPTKVSVAARVSSGTGTLTLQQYASGSWSEIASWTLSSTGTVFSKTITGAGTAVAFRLTGAKVTTIYDVAVASADGSLVSSTAVSGLSHTFTGLDPFTVYYARVKGNAEWSSIVEFITDEPAGTAPVWSAIPTQTVTVGQDCDLDLASYVSGTDPITITMADTELDAVLVGTEFSFTPDTVGTSTFTFTAANGFGSADATLTVTATGTAPSWSAIPAQTVAVGADCDLDLAAYVSGTPTPTITMADTEYDAVLVGTEFSFTPDAPGTFTFTFTAANGVGSPATATLTVTATGDAPVVTVTPATYSYNVNVGDPYVEFTVTASGNPAPALSATCTESAYFIFENNAFLFDPDTAGTYHFVFTATSAAGSDTKTVTVTVTAPVATYSVTVASGIQNGSISVDVSEAVEGAMVTVTATPAAGYKLEAITVNGTPIEGTTFSMPAADVTVGATFVEKTAMTATYTVASKTNVTVTGTTPAGSSATYSSTYGTIYQLTSGNSMTLTLSGYTGATITGLTLSMRSNGSGGGGTLSATCSTATIASIADSKFNTASWHGSWSTNYVDVTPAVTSTLVDGNVVITIAATANSLYCQSFTIEYEPGTPSGTAPTLAPIADRTISLEDGGVEFTVTATGDPAPTFSVTSSDAPVGDYEIGENDGEFAFIAYSAGTYHFTVTAANGILPDASQSFTITVEDSAVIVDTFEDWLADHNASGHTAAQKAPNGYTYWQNYVADVDPSSSDFLEVDFATTDGYIEIKNASPNRYYQILVYEDLLDDPVAIDLGVGSADMTVVFPLDDETFFARVRVLLSAP